MREAEAAALLVMAIPSYGRRARALAQAGSATQLLSDPEELSPVLGDALGALTQAVRRADALLEDLRREQIELIAPGDEGWPASLSEISNPPHVLFCKGKANLCDPLALGAVGTRDASPYGLRQARRIAAELAATGCCVVSGLALGIDAACHEGALDAHGRTVAVLGGAHDRFYPRENRPLMERILEGGGSVISEYPPGTRPSRYSFLHRNRIIAGMTRGVLIVEGKMRSGAMNTAHAALDAGRDVFALPGNVDEPRSALPNRLIADGAALVCCGDDILGALGMERPQRESPPALPEKPRRAQIPATLGDAERAICKAILPDGADFDVLCAAMGMDAEMLGTLLVEMEMDGYVETLPGNRIGPGEALG